MDYVQIASKLGDEWIDNYIAMFEAGRVQKHPHARFVNAAGECCLVAGLVAARNGAEVVASGVWAAFPGSGLELLSRGFETCRLSGQEFYEICLLVRASRRAARAPRATAGVFTIAR